jgi:hypothetical protein
LRRSQTAMECCGLASAGPCGSCQRSRDRRSHQSP